MSPYAFDVTSALAMTESHVAVSGTVDLEAVWLDRLVVAVCAMPLDSGESAVVEFLVRLLGDMFPACAVGVCFVATPHGIPHGGASRRGSDAPPSRRDRPAPEPLSLKPQVFKVVPEGQEARSEGMDPTRIFPGFAYERVLEVNIESGASATLHFAGDNAQLEDDSPVMHVVRRAALALGRGLELARRHAKATSDTRELRALHAHMAQASKLASLGQIAAGVVHELNNPLTSIVAYTDWLVRKHGPAGDADVLERLRRISESARRILRFTRDLVAYARPSSEVPVPVSLHNVIEQALAFCEHVLAEHGALVERALLADSPWVRGMPEQLVQVFVNLFTNACHAMPEHGGKLVVATVHLVADASRLVVSVEDNGHGIDHDHVNQIFAPFFTTKVDGHGTGLGLSIVKNILDNHAAEIRVERGDSGGARFVLVFPVAVL